MNSTQKKASTLSAIQGALGVSLVAFTLYTAFFGVLPDGLQRSFHLLLVVVFVWISAIADPTENDEKLGALHTAILVLAIGCALVTLGHHLVNYDAINDRYGAITSYEMVFGIILVLVLVDACRRAIGWSIVILASLFVLYALFGRYLPSGLGHRGYSLERVVSQIYLGGGGIFGTPLGVSATFVTIVVVLGALLEKTGAGKVLMDIATVLTGGFRGGPAKAAVVGSSLMGMISGTAVANVLTTGPVSIPLMKKSGYRPEAAGAIEAVASTGGQLMPPVMGAAAFIMAEFTNTSYLVIAKAAFLPAVVFYAVLLAMVHFEAVRHNIPILASDKATNPWRRIAREAHLLLPLPVFVWMLLGGYSIMLSGFWAVIASWAVSYASRATFLLPRDIVEACVFSIRAVAPVALACAAAGIIIGMITMTGIGLKFSSLVVALSGGNLFVALVLTMFSCLILGMGLPTAAAYILVATLVAPALVNLGVPLLAAHLFVLYSAMLSSITPPVALAAYAAASVANANPLKIALLAVQFGVAAFVVPYFFVYDPAILGIDTTWVQISLSFVTAILGGICASAAITGYLSGKLDPLSRLALIAAAALFLASDWKLDLTGVVIAAIVVAVNLSLTRKQKSHAQSEA